MHEHSSSWTPAAYEAEESLSALSKSTSSTKTSGWRAGRFRLGVATLGGSSMTMMGFGRAPYGGHHGSCDDGARRGGCGRQVPAVLRIHHRASDFVHRQSAGHFSRYAQCQTVQGTVPDVVQRQVRGQATGLSWGPSSHVSRRWLAEEFMFLGFLLALFALGNMVHDFLVASYLVVTLLVSGCCLWSTENWILLQILRLLGRSTWLDSGYVFCVSTWRFRTICTHFPRRSGLEF